MRERPRRRRRRRRQHLREPAAVRRRRGPRSYPRDLDRDTALAGEAGVDVIFVPDGRRDVPPAGADDRSRSTSSPAVLEGASRPGALRRRRHGGRQAVRHRRAVPRLLRREGLPAAADRPPHGRRPVPARRGRRLPDRAGDRRPGDVEPQRLPRPRGATGGARSCAGPSTAGDDLVASGEVEPGGDHRPPWRPCHRRRTAGRARLRGGASTPRRSGRPDRLGPGRDFACWWPPGSACPASSTTSASPSLAVLRATEPVPDQPPAIPTPAPAAGAGPTEETTTWRR